MITRIRETPRRVTGRGMTESWRLDMTKSKGVYRPRGISLAEWLRRNSTLTPGPLDTPCQLWAGRVTNKGYGRIDVVTGSASVHRLAWVLRHGEPPAVTPWVLHRCDVRHCFADDHLFLGTHQDNMDDMVTKGRQRGGGQPGLASGNGKKDRCKHGHLFDETNTYLRVNGNRACRACKRIDAFRRYYQGATP